MSLPDSDVLEIRDTLNVVLTGIDHYERATLLCLAPAMLALSSTVPSKSLEEYSDAELRALLRGIARSLFEKSPEALKSVDKILETLELEYIRNNQT